MRKVFTDPDFTKVGHYASILESAGIPAVVKNDLLSTAELMPINQPPQLWVLDDENYEPAIEILKQFEEEE